jgi:membrane dipeptidase
MVREERRLMPNAEDLIGRHLLWDNHGCLPIRPEDPAFLPQLQRYRAAGFDMAVINIGFGDESVETHLAMLKTLRTYVLANPGLYRLAEVPDDIVAARAEGKLAIAFDIEGANAIGDRLELVQHYHALGVRWMLIAYNRTNRAGAGCMEEDDGGLTPFGERLIAEMERVGLQICLSHTGHRTARDVLSRATKPVIFSHSNAAAVHAHPRNIGDDLIRACAESGGVVGINGIGDFLGPPEADLEEMFVRHIDHMVQLVGPEYVGLGFDHVFDVAELEDYLATQQHLFPPGTFNPQFRQLSFEAVPALVGRLLALGYGEDAIAAILGGNLLRVARAVWKPPAAPI